MIKRALGRVVRDDTGVTVIELVIASTLAFIILLALFMTLDSATKNERGQQARTEAMIDVRQAMTRMTKETRQALSLSPTSTRTKIDMQTYVGGARNRVTYELVSGTITRKACVEPSATPSCSLPTTGHPLASSVIAVNPGPPATTVSVFCYDPPICALPAPLSHPRSVRISMGIHPEVFSGGPITLATDVKLRNT